MMLLSKQFFLFFRAQASLFILSIVKSDQQFSKWSAWSLVKFRSGRHWVAISPDILVDFCVHGVDVDPCIWIAELLFDKLCAESNWSLKTTIIPFKIELQRSTVRVWLKFCDLWFTVCEHTRTSLPEVSLFIWYRARVVIVGIFDQNVLSLDAIFCVVACCPANSSWSIPESSIFGWTKLTSAYIVPLNMVCHRICSKTACATSSLDIFY